MWRILVLLAALAAGGGSAWAQAAPAASGAAPLPTAAERIYDSARQRLLQIRTVVLAAGGQASIGSGFLVGRDGLAITNYHVISQFALDPQAYRLDYALVDGTHGNLEILAIDLADDLALVRIDRKDLPFFDFDERAVEGAVPKGERLYSLGNPLDLGFTIVEGTYNGLVERSYNERVHFSGAINPGMSGGPTVTAEGRIAGINVAKQLGGELVSFLVPAHFAAKLLREARDRPAPAPQDLVKEVGRQLTAWQTGLFASFDELGFRTASLGAYQAPESAAPWFTCWSQTNGLQIPKPRASIDTTNCTSNTRLFVANDLNTGFIRVTNSYVRSVDLNQFQFAAFLSRQFQGAGVGGLSRKWYTRQSCQDDFVAAAPAADHPPLRAVWCARAYRPFDGLYDVALTTVTQDKGKEAMISQLTLQGVRLDNAVTLAQHFVETVQWKK